MVTCDAVTSVLYTCTCGLSWVMGFCTGMQIFYVFVKEAWI